MTSPVPSVAGMDAGPDAAGNPNPGDLLLLVDGHSLAFRAYYAHAKGRDGGLRTSTGIPTSVCFGFLKSLLETLDSHQPQRLAIAFDLDQPTFRHEKTDTYKAGRTETPPDFITDMQNLQGLLAGMGLAIVTAPGYEADDVIGTLAQQGRQAGMRVKILSGDRDMFQLIDPGDQVSVLYPSRKDGLKEMTSAEVEATLGIRPDQVVDYKALSGDKSDNIPGVDGIGEKTAVKLLQQYGDLAGVYTHLGEIKGAVQKRLAAGQEAAETSQLMARIVTNVPLAVGLEDCRLRGFDPGAVMAELQRLELQHFINRLPQMVATLGGETPVPVNPEADNPPTVGSPPPPAAPAWEDPDLAFFTAEETAQAQGVQSATIAPQIITTEAQLYDLLDRLATHTDPAQPVAWDTETTSLEPRDAALVGIGCCWGPGPQDLAYIPVGHQDGPQLPLAFVLDTLRLVLEDGQYPKVLQNAKYDRLVLHHQGITLAGVVFDPMLASYVLNPDDRHNLTDLCLKYLNLQAQSYGDLVPKGKTIAEVPIAAAAQYCGTDVHTTYALVAPLRAALQKDPPLAALFDQVEMPLETLLATMETQGIRIDIPYLATLSQQLGQDLQRLEQEAHHLAGIPFNLASPKQLSTLLFDTLGLDKRKSRKNKSGGYSTDAATLEKLQGDHPLVDLILEHRTLAKLKSTYVDALPELVRPETGRVHTDFNQAVTATGRLSSSNPNLQNIPIRTAFSRQIRAAFLPEPGWLLVSADYSQIELRILAHLSQEPRLVEAYNQGQDVHTLTARLLFDKEEITPEERRAGKILNFGVIYGMGAVRFAREMGVSRQEAKGFIDRYYERYPQVFAYLQQVQQQAIAQGYVETLLGRRRYFQFESRRLQELKGCDPATIDLDDLGRISNRDAAALRAAANAPIQGSNADIIKRAMIHLAPHLAPYQARLLLQVHDELVLEVPPEQWPQLEPHLKQVMESAMTLRVPLVVEAHSGPNWMEAK